MNTNTLFSKNKPLMADIIESKGIANIAKLESNIQLPLSHEKILFSTIKESSDSIMTVKSLSNDVESEQIHRSEKIEKMAPKKWTYKSSLNI